ncbi:MAG: homocysteine S-methyltransferase family protein [Gammaproteobacteria bacterium]|nr:homocysteine S-methyltransferase family protein [Gammaproteobacteria bacterium]
MTTSRYQSVLTEIKSGATLVIDAGTGSELQRRGAAMEREAWCALGTETHPKILREIHEDYIKAGAQLITANTFASTREILEPIGLGDKFAELNKRSVELAVEARERVPTQKDILVAGSITHITPSARARGMSYYSDPEKFEADCTEMAAIHKAAGCDLILAEMMGDPIYAPCVFRAVKANDLPLWIGISAIRDADGSLVNFEPVPAPLNDVLEPIVTAGIDAGTDVMGIMHSKADATFPALQLLRKFWSGPLMAYPDSVAYRDSEDDKDLNLGSVMDKQRFVDYCDDWKRHDVQVLGGCCGLSVSHIQALTNYLAGQNT